MFSASTPAKNAAPASIYEGCGVMEQIRHYIHDMSMFKNLSYVMTSSVKRKIQI